MKIFVILLIACTAGLGAFLLVQHNKAVKQKEADEAAKAELHRHLEQTRSKLEEQEQVNMVLQTNLVVRNQELQGTSNTLVKTAADLAKTQKEAQATAEAAKAEMAKRDAKIAELEGQNEALDRQANDLKTAITGLEQSIAETEKKLAASEGDREFLLKELKRLQTEKAELERQFNDLAALRSQVAKIKEELSISRRLEWIRMGIYGMQAQKGAERLMQTPALAATGSLYNLNVELKQDGSATVVPGQTNTPPKPPAAK